MHLSLGKGMQEWSLAGAFHHGGWNKNEPDNSSDNHDGY